MNFEYYYGTQADQFSFIRIPRILLLDEAFSVLSLSAKVLYSVLLDRMGLSMKNKWLDEENKVYIIYQITEIQSDLGFSKKKAMDYLTELEKIGLIEKKKRGFGLPNIIPCIMRLFVLLLFGITHASLCPFVLFREWRAVQGHPIWPQITVCGGKTILEVFLLWQSFL